MKIITPISRLFRARGENGPSPAPAPCLWLLTLMVLASPGQLSAAGTQGAAAALEPQAGQVEVIILRNEEPIVIRADRIEHDEALDLIRLSGRISLRRGLETLTADRAVWHNQTGTAEIAGSVRLTAPSFTMEAERAAVNMEMSLAKMYQGRIFFSQGNYYLNGTVIERLSEKEFEVIEASATTCDGPSPAWTIQAEHLTVTQGGYASATGVVFKGNGSAWPLFASPYLIFPVKTERQSGILKPSLGTSSQSGLTFSLPFFWATGENHDLTYTPVWRENRGLSSTLEGRYHQLWGRGLWQVSYLNDQAERFYRFSGSQELRQARERFWLRAQNQGQAGEWDLSLNLDLASDPLYLREFTGQPDGFDQSHQAFISNFGRTVNESLNPNRSSEFYAQKLDGSTQIRGGLYYTQNLYNEGNRNTLMRLPALQYDLVGRSLGDDLAYGGQGPRFSLTTGYDHFSRQTDENSAVTETGHRLRFQPTMDWTRNIGPVNLKLTGGLEMAAYAAAGRRPAFAGGRFQAEHERWYNLLAGSAEAEFSTTFSRTFEGGPGQAVATRHQLSPVLAFKYAEAPENQGRLPYWDQFDRRLPRRTIRYGLENSLVSKTPIPNLAADSAENPPPAPAFNYSQFLKFGLWSSYEMADNSHLAAHPSDRYYFTDSYDRGSGSLEASLEAALAPHLSTRLISTFNTRTGRPESHYLSLNLADNRGDRLALIYDYGAPESQPLPGEARRYQEARANLNLVLNSEWSTSFATRYDITDNKFLNTTAQLSYQAQCYGLHLIYNKTYQEQSLGVVIDLLGLGSLDFLGPSIDD